MANSIIGILRDARAPLRDPNRWCQGSYDCGDLHCAIGAVGQAAGARPLYGPGETAFRKTAVNANKAVALLDTAAKSLGYEDSIQLNDRADHKKVLRMFNRAIKRASR